MNEHQHHASEYGQLIALRQKLAAFRTMPCRLLHEKAVHVTEDIYSVDPDYPGLNIRRKGFCTKELRNITLGCAHTIANAVFTRLIDELNAITGTPEGPMSWSELPGVIMAVYKLDHEKGDLEKRLAVLRYRDAEEEQQFINDRLDTLTGEHNQAIARLETIRQDALKTLDQLIALCGSTHRVDLQ